MQTQELCFLKNNKTLNRIFNINKKKGFLRTRPLIWKSLLFNVFGYWCYENTAIWINSFSSWRPLHTIPYLIRDSALLSFWKSRTNNFWILSKLLCHPNVWSIVLLSNVCIVIFVFINSIQIYQCFFIYVLYFNIIPCTSDCHLKTLHHVFPHQHFA